MLGISCYKPSSSPDTVATGDDITEDTDGITKSKPQNTSKENENETVNKVVDVEEVKSEDDVKPKMEDVEKEEVVPKEDKPLPKSRSQLEEEAALRDLDLEIKDTLKVS